MKFHINVWVRVNVIDVKIRTRDLNDAIRSYLTSNLFSIKLKLRRNVKVLKMFNLFLSLTCIRRLDIFCLTRRDSNTRFCCWGHGELGFDHVQRDGALVQS